MPLLANMHTDAGGTDVAVIFGVDASSYQGSVNWTSVDRTCEFGVEKVTEGTGYTNPYWSAAKIAMKARSVATGFIPGAYLFLDAGDGAAQADHFAAAAGNLDGFMIAIDVERSKGNPTTAQAKACVARLRQHYPKHPIGGYIPRWYWSGTMGSPSLTWVDYLWQSAYVDGSGSPSSLYSKVGSSAWAAFGGMTPKILQFSSSGSVGGISGHCDVNAFRGTTAQLRALAVGGSAPAPQEDDVPIRSSYSKTKAQDIPWGVATPLNWDVENADPEKAHAGATKDHPQGYPGYVAPLATWADMFAQVTIDGLAAGDEWQLAYQVHDWDDQKGVSKSTWTEIVADFPATTGHQYGSGSWSKGLSKGQHIYVAVTVWPAGGDAKGRKAPQVISGRWTVAQDKA